MSQEEHDEWEAEDTGREATEDDEDDNDDGDGGEMMPIPELFG